MNINCHSHLRAALAAALMLTSAPHRASAVELLSDDFSTGDGGFTQTTSGTSPVPAIYNGVAGTWAFPGDGSGPSNNTLTSPPVTMPVTGGLRIRFDHRYSTNAGWDGIVLQLSINGGSFVYVPQSAFTQNGYNMTILGNNETNEMIGKRAFSYFSPGWTKGEFTTSIAEVGAFAAGDTIQVRFRAGWDVDLVGEGLNWQLDRLIIETQEDSDGDGMSDRYEEHYRLDGAVDDSALDDDSDGLTNLEEFLRNTNPRDADTDDDGLADAAEVATDPLEPDLTGQLPGLLYHSDFNTDNGRFSSEVGGSSPVAATYSPGTWRFPGDGSGASFSSLTSPPITVPSTGSLQLYLKHRHKFEYLWDGGVIEYSVNGGSYQRVTPAQFSQYGYNVDFMHPAATTPFSDQPAFNRATQGYSSRQFITTVAEIGTLKKNDVIRIRFLGWWDAATVEPAPNWELDEVAVQLRRDTDGDGMADHLELANGLELNADDAGLDQDGDSLSNLDELLRGTLPRSADSDGDGLGDDVETNRGFYTDADDTGTSPLAADTDQDGLTDSIEVLETGTDPTLADTDHDGFDDSYEIEAGTDPRDTAAIPVVKPDLEWSAAHHPDGMLRIWRARHNRITGEASVWGFGDFGLVESGSTNFRNVTSWIHRPLYFFRQSQSASTSSWEGAFGDSVTRQNATWELVFRPGDFSSRYCLFNIGGRSAGVGLFLFGTTMEFRFQGADTDANRVVVSTDLSLLGSPSDFYHVIAVADVTSASAGTGSLYVNGVLVGGPFTSAGPIDDWSGSDDAELGFGLNVPGEGSFQGDYFTGDIAAFNFYRNQALDAEAIVARHQRYAGSPPEVVIQDIRHLSGTDELAISWESQAGLLYTLRSESEPFKGTAASWPIYGGHQDIMATPPLNTLIIPRPADDSRFFVIEAQPRK